MNPDPTNVPLSTNQVPYETEMTNLTEIVKEAGNRLIEISAAQDTQMQKWSDADARPDGMSVTECLGFINKDNPSEGIEMTLDLLVPSNLAEATLRLWAITSDENDRHVVLFNNIQLTFRVSLGLAKVVAIKADAFSRDDLRAILHDEQTKLSNLVISVQSGMDNTTGQQVGNRYNLSPVTGPEEYHNNRAILKDIDSKNAVTTAEVQQTVETVLGLFNSNISQG